MKRSIREKWLNALRSGEYKQGHENLRRDDTYCCLGVLCDLDGAKWESLGRGLYRSEGDGRFYPSNERLEKLGIARNVAHNIAKMNDNAGKSFAQIAHWIEANVRVEED